MIEISIKRNHTAVLYYVPVGEFELLLDDNLNCINERLGAFITYEVYPDMLHKPDIELKDTISFDKNAMNVRIYSKYKGNIFCLMRVLSYDGKTILDYDKYNTIVTNDSATIDGAKHTTITYYDEVKISFEKPPPSQRRTKIADRDIVIDE
jgi:hypothetical protein